MTKKRVAIIQARMASTRLFGKVLLEIRGHTVLAHVAQRCKAIPGVAEICCAVPQEPKNDPVAAEAARCGITVCRGSEQDVLDRYWAAARATKADVILRVTSDCPLIDPGICGAVLALVADGGADYACNNFKHSWPHGLDCEAFSFEVLARAAREANDPYQREHVTPWMRDHPDLKTEELTGPGGWAAEQRWTLDFPEDLDFFRALFENVPAWPSVASTDDILGIIRKHPEITALNAQHRNTSRPRMAETARKQSLRGDEFH